MARTTIPIELSSTPSIVDGGNATAITINASENVGIGTSPDFRLHVSGTGVVLGLNATSGAVSQRFNENGTARFFLSTLNGSNGLAFVNGDGTSERMRIDNSGNLLVGRTSTSGLGKLNVEGGADFTGGNVYLCRDSGNVLVGTSSSINNALLNVNGGINTTSGIVGIFTSDTFTLNGRTQPHYGINFDPTQASGTRPIGISGYAGIAFASFGSERMRIDSSGNLMVGTTTTRTGTNSISIESGNVYQMFRAPGTGSLQQVAFVRNTAGTPATAGTISTTGTATTYATSSDYRLKENVVTDWDATTRLKQLKPSRFNFISDPDKTVDGFLAHEVQAIVPEAITGTKDAVDAEGNPDYQGIDQSKLVPLLVKVIQELEARITTLEG
jgi:hypothetical protein